MEINSKKLDELYKGWSGEHHTTNSNKQVHDSAECLDFAEYCLKWAVSEGEMIPTRDSNCNIPLVTCRFKSITMENILNEIKAERKRQNVKWGEQNHSVIEWQAILMEEVGEAAKEATDFHFRNPYLNGRGEMQDVLENDVVQHLRLKDYRKELIQVAAVAVQMVECLDRNGT